MVSFLKLPAEKKTQFFLNLKQIFGPSYIVKALSKHALLLNRSLKVGSKKTIFYSQTLSLPESAVFFRSVLYLNKKGQIMNTTLLHVLALLDFLTFLRL